MNLDNIINTADSIEQLKTTATRAAGLAAIAKVLSSQAVRHIPMVSVTKMVDTLIEAATAESDLIASKLTKDDV